MTTSTPYATTTLQITSTTPLRFECTDLPARSGSPRDFLDNRPGQKYTTILTLECSTKAPILDHHAARIDVSAYEIHCILRHLRFALGKSLKPADGTETEMIAVLVASPIENGYVPRIDALAYPIARARDQGARQASVAVDVAFPPRTTPRKKCSSWSLTRRPLEAARREGCAETVLVEDGCMYEGSVSNLFVLRRDGVMMTAPDEVVLNGALRRVVLEVCAKRGIVVEMRTPRVDEVGGFGAAFLTAVNRVLQPVGCFWKGEECLEIAGCKEAEETVDGIRKDVWRRVLAGAVDIVAEASDG